VFYTERTPGVTAASPLYDASGALIGVYGVDTQLRVLSDFVSALDVSPNGEAFIIDDHGGLLAYRDTKAVVRETNDRNEAYQLSTAAQLGDDLVAASYQAFADAKVGKGQTFRSNLVAQGRTVRVELVPLRVRDDWYVAVVAPEEDFVGQIIDAQRRNA